MQNRRPGLKLNRLPHKALFFTSFSVLIVGFHLVVIY
jgi:hypothetical protein